MIPTTARTASGFVPKGWFIYEQAAGDLNRDGIPDLALVLANEREHTTRFFIGGDDSIPKRRLVIALGTSDGYRRTVVDTRAVPRESGEHCANIRKGILLLKLTTLHPNASEINVDKYEWREGAFEQIGHTELSSSQAGEFTTDTNLVTGLVEEQNSLGSQMHLVAAEHLFDGKRSYREVAVGSRPTLPTDLSLPLTAMPVALRTRPDVSVGGSRWRGPDDFSATLTAAMVGNGRQARLCLRASVIDSRGDNADQVRLLSGRGKLVRATSERRQRTPKGLVWEGWCDLTPLGLEYHKDRAADSHGDVSRWFFHDKSAGNRDFLRSTVEVVRPKTGTTLSTTQGGRRIPGVLWLTTGTHLPRLGEVTDVLYSY